MQSVNNQKTSCFVRGKGLFLLLMPRLSMKAKHDSNSQEGYVANGLYGIGTFHSLLAALVHGAVFDFPTQVIFCFNNLCG
jgi:hypothetical protein